MKRFTYNTRVDPENNDKGNERNHRNRLYETGIAHFGPLHADRPVCNPEHPAKHIDGRENNAKRPDNGEYAGILWNKPRNAINSATKPDRPGRPKEAIPETSKIPEINGIDFANPPSSSSRVVCVRSKIAPTSKNMSAEIKP